MNDKLLTVSELSEKLNISKSTILNWARQGKIPAIKLGRQWRFKLLDVEMWLKTKSTNFQGVSTARSLLKYAGTWKGDDAEKIFKEIRESRAEAEF